MWLARIPTVGIQLPEIVWLIIFLVVIYFTLTRVVPGAVLEERSRDVLFETTKKQQKGVMRILLRIPSRLLFFAVVTFPIIFAFVGRAILNYLDAAFMPWMHLLILIPYLAIYLLALAMMRAGNK